MENLPPDAGLQHLRVTVGNSFGTITYIGPPDNIGLQQFNVILPELEETGLLPVEVQWLGQRISPPAVLRVIPPGPSVPCVASVTDGMNLVAGKRIETRMIKVMLEEISRPHEIEASVDGHPVSDLEFFCVDPRPQKFEVNLRLPEQIGVGPHQLGTAHGPQKASPDCDRCSFLNLSGNQTFPANLRSQHHHRERQPVAQFLRRHPRREHRSRDRSRNPADQKLDDHAPLKLPSAA